MIAIPNGGVLTVGVYREACRGALALAFSRLVQQVGQQRARAAWEAEHDRRQVRHFARIAAARRLWRGNAGPQAAGRRILADAQSMRSLACLAAVCALGPCHAALVAAWLGSSDVADITRRMCDLQFDGLLVPLVEDGDRRAVWARDGWPWPRTTSGLAIIDGTWDADHAVSMARSAS